jgi:predicted HicB family RNase H-like nuclease
MFFGLMVAFMGGCHSHDAKVADLQKQYDEINRQFAKDCSAEMLNLPDKLSPKCADESKKLKEATDRLQAERAKKQ